MKLIITMNTKCVLFLIVLLFSSSLVFSKNFLKNKHTSFVEMMEIREDGASQAFCYLNSNGTVFDLNPLYNSTADYAITGDNYKVNFNVCKNSLNKCGNKTSLVKYVPTVNGIAGETCVNLAGSATVVSNWQVLTDTTTNGTSLRVILPPGDVCQSDNKKNYTTTLVIKCDKEALVPKITSQNVDINSCNNTISMIAEAACPEFNVYSFWNAIINNKYIFGTIVIIGGIFLCFFGLKFIYATQVLTGVLATSFILMFILFNYMKVEYNSMDFWLIIAVSVLAGIIVGYFLAKNEKLPVLMIAGFCGYILGTFLYQFVLKYVNSNPQVVFWVTIISSILLLLVIAWFFQKHVLIIGTSFVGAYAIVRGISFMAGGFPDERQIIDLINKGESAQVSQMLDWKVYIYLASMVIIGIVGAYIQYKYFYTPDEQDDKTNKHQDETNQNLIDKK